MTVYDAVCQRRSIRKFQQREIPKEILSQLVNSARFAPSGANIQPCEYIIIQQRPLLEAIFPCLKWAAYIQPEGTPNEEERPVAYIIVLIDYHKKKKGGEIDAAAAIQNILITAFSYGIGSCWLGSIKRKKIKKILRIPHHLHLPAVLALGYPKESPIIEDAANSIKYWKDPNGDLHVPKRKLEDVCHFNGYRLNHLNVKNEFRDEK